MPAPVKNRYLRLDASPVEHGQFKRLFSPGILSATFLISVVIHGEELEDFGSLVEPFMYAAVGMGLRRGFGVLANTVWLGDFNRFVIDTQPSASTMSRAPDFYKLRALTMTGLNTAIPIVCASTFAWKYDTASLTEALAHHMKEGYKYDITNLLPTELTGISQIMAYRNVQSGKWKVVRKDDMELAVAPQPLALTPGAA